MSATRIGGLKAVKTNKERHGEDFYSRIGAIGGRAKRPTKGFGFKWDCKCSEFPFAHKHPQCAGRRGGRISKRKKANA